MSGLVKDEAPRARRYATLSVGWALLVAGGLLLFLPGPGLPLVLGGLAVLGREAAWARRLRERVEVKFFRRARPPAETRSSFTVRDASE